MEAYVLKQLENRGKGFKLLYNEVSMNKRNLQAGFTLIEIVMVLVLLGILAAVAAPKYFDLQASARQKAAQAAVAEVQARINSKFAQQLLAGDKCSSAKTTALSELTANSGKFGDFTITASMDDDTGSGVAPTVTFNNDTVTLPSTTKLYAPVCSASN